MQPIHIQWILDHKIDGQHKMTSLGALGKTGV